MVSSIERFNCIQYSQLGPSGVLYREVPLYTGQPAGSQWCPLYIERFHCIQYSQLGPNGVLYREVQLEPVCTSVYQYKSPISPSRVGHHLITMLTMKTHTHGTVRWCANETQVNEPHKDSCCDQWTGEHWWNTIWLYHTVSGPSLPLEPITLRWRQGPTQQDARLLSPFRRPLTIGVKMNCQLSWLQLNPAVDIVVLGEHPACHIHFHFNGDM